MPEKQQDILITIIVASVFLVLLGIFLLVLLFLFLRRQRKNQKEKEEMRNYFEKMILTTQIEIQNQTISYVGEEIHDNIGQILFLAKITNKQLTEFNIDEKIVEIDKLLSRALGDLRSISHDLKNSSFHQIGFTESIAQLLLIIKKTGKYTTHFNGPASDEIDDLLGGNEIILFRIIQEVINNILKHAEATRIAINIEKTDHGFLIIIEDNGKGFEFDKKDHGEFGIGLKNIYDRAKLINTTVTIHSKLGVGTSVILNFKNI